MTCTVQSLPKAVRITDVTARDGFQIIKDWIPTEVKIELIDALAAAGITKMEATSFVSPKAVPQMADAELIAAHMREKLPQVAFVALAPNYRGAENAVKCGVPEISYIISASPAHNKANINRTHEESLNDLAAITAAFPDLTINLSMSAVFGCPFDGETPIKTVTWLLGESIKRGASSVSLCDTIGVGNPVQVRAVAAAVRDAFPAFPVAMHLHDTHGMGLANTYAAMQMGIDCFETAVGGLGGCPFAPGAAGNTSTEDTINMLHRMGVKTGVDLEKLLGAVAIIKEKVSANLPGHLASARTYSEFCFFQCT